MTDVQHEAGYEDHVVVDTHGSAIDPDVYWSKVCAIDGAAVENFDGEHAPIADAPGGHEAAPYPATVWSTG